jgi:hypothetical protein
MGIGAAMLSADWVVLASLWEAPTVILFFSCSFPTMIIRNWEGKTTHSIKLLIVDHCFFWDVKEFNLVEDV